MKATGVASAALLVTLAACNTRFGTPNGQVPDKMQFAPPGDFAGTCLNLPLPVDGADVGLKVGVLVGDYARSTIVRQGADGDAEVSLDANNVIQILMHPKQRYQADEVTHDNVFYVSVGMLSAGTIRYKDDACGNDGSRDLPDDGTKLHFRGDFKFASPSTVPSALGPGNAVLGGYLGYGFDGGAVTTLAVRDLAVGATAGQVHYGCGNSLPNDGPHELLWGDWWNASLVDQWYSFDIDLTKQNGIAVSASAQCGQGRRDLGEAVKTKVIAALVTTEYSSDPGGTTLISLRNLRLEQ